MDDQTKIAEVCRRNLKEWAYEIYGLSVYVAKENVLFIRQKFHEAGLTCVRVYSRPF
jgi:hypothetical protein